MKSTVSILVSLFFLALYNAKPSVSCDSVFQGFGVYVGTPTHMNDTNVTFVEGILDTLYEDLQIRHFRINYLPYFSPNPNEYTISCTTSQCEWTWDTILRRLSNSARYPDNITFIASVWSPPYYMKEINTHSLRPEFELDFYFYLKNVTQLIYDKYGIVVQRVSPINEPDNFFASWDHCNTPPSQICRMVEYYNDPLIALCPENSHFWITQLYLLLGGQYCVDACDIIATHGYFLNLSPGSLNFGLAYYDLGPHHNKWGNKRIWMTEVSSTYKFPWAVQMEEALALATSIINFVGTTCVERYYFWYAFSKESSGESLIWLNANWSAVFYPKKYFVYRQFTRGSMSVGRNVTVINCDEADLVAVTGKCLLFSGNESKVAVFLNRDAFPLDLNPSRVNCTDQFCCTTEKFDYKCNWDSISQLPPESICTCRGELVATTSDAVSEAAQSR